MDKNIWFIFSPLLIMVFLLFWPLLAGIFVLRHIKNTSTAIFIACWAWVAQVSYLLLLYKVLGL